MYPYQNSQHGGQPLGFEGLNSFGGNSGAAPYPSGDQSNPPYPQQSAQPYPSPYPQTQQYPVQQQFQQTQQQQYQAPSYPSLQSTPSGYPAQQAQGQSYPQQHQVYPQQTAYPSSGGPPRPSGTGPNAYSARQPLAYPQQQVTHRPAATSAGYGSQQQMAFNCQGTVRPLPGFNPNADSEALRKAMKGLGCNNTAVIGVLCARTNAQRQQIALAFKTMYGKDLIKELRDELRGDFEELILALMELPARYDAQQLRKAMEGLGTKESVLIEIMCTRTNEEIWAIKQQYKYLFGGDLEKDLSSETSGHFRRLLVSMSAGGRDQSNTVDMGRAHQDAQALYRAGEKRLGTDESTFNAIIAAQNYAQLRAVFQEYEKVAGHGIEKAIQGEFSGDVRDGLMTCVQCVKNRPAYFAQGLHESMKGFGTQDTHLIRIVVTRCEIEMVQIKQEFQRMYGKSLETFIKGDCSGSYKNGLIALVTGN